MFDIEQGCDKDGHLTFRHVEAVLDNGAYTSWGATTPSVMMTPISSLYRVPNVYFKATCVYTNNIYCQAMRGYGTPRQPLRWRHPWIDWPRRPGSIRRCSDT